MRNVSLPECGRLFHLETDGENDFPQIHVYLERGVCNAQRRRVSLHALSNYLGQFQAVKVTQFDV